ncbi:imidazole glycerol phosphate synthase subunit HisF [Marinilabiliaceae bacterium ANBcel2]|nr:imidazole glycerol phosphate synthase subunit HisF [Marinilabiliaceae bacterium ANBcel2]
MLAKRIIPCLDIKDGETVKGVKFVDLKNVGDPVELARAYAEQGADELVFLDITASFEGRKTFVKLVENIAKHINIPFTVGGGISEVDDAKVLLDAGADKISINSAAVANPNLINDLAAAFGSQFVVVAVDAKENMNLNDWVVTVKGGREFTDKRLFSWVKEAEERGAGEILFTSMDHDGVKQGFANDALRRISETISIPVIASGGAGAMSHFKDAFILGKADAALAASVFHYNEISVPDLKAYLKQEGVTVR